MLQRYNVERMGIKKLGQGIQRKNQGISGDVYGYETVRSRIWGKRDLKNIPEERLHGRVTQHGSECGIH